MEVLLLVLFHLSFSGSTPVTWKQEDDISFANKFMSRFGYLREDGGPQESLVRAEDAVREVQRFAGLPQTGILDLHTLQLMRSPRCGLPDIVHNKSSSSSSRYKRYALASTGGWTKRHLTYSVSSWNSELGQGAVRAELRKALDAWAKYGGLQFQEVYASSADIQVQFGKGEHGDGYPFDGPGSTLAHAFTPAEGLGGDIHFDDEETWRVNPKKEEADSGDEDFFSVAVHEVGHSLGLHHSSNQESVMYPYYKQYDSASFALDYDAISGMYKLYHKNLKNGVGSGDRPRSRTTTTTTRKPTTQRPVTTTRSHFRTGTTFSDKTFHRHPDERFPHHGFPFPGMPHVPRTPMEVPNICDGHFDAVSFLRGEIFIFKGDYVWRLSSPGRMAPGFPVTIHRMFPQLPETIHRIDAVYERKTDGSLIFFSDDHYCVHNGNRVVVGPRPITDFGLPSYLRRVDAAMVWGRNKKTYIFSKDRYWRFDEDSESMDPDYPKSVELFRDVPCHLDSAMTWSDGITYFFKDDLYWGFDNTWLQAQVSYPKGAAEFWLGCQGGQPSHLLHFHREDLNHPKTSAAAVLSSLRTVHLVFLLLIASLL